MNLKIDRKKEILKVSDVSLEHNHKLHLPETLHLMVSQRTISDLQAFEIETTDLQACSSIFKIKWLRTLRSYMPCKWIVKNK
jgi:hypothetical protein